MGTKSVRLDEEVYERVERIRRDDETFSEALERLIRGVSLLELEGTLSDEAADDAHKAIERSSEADRAASRELYDES